MEQSSQPGSKPFFAHRKNIFLVILLGFALVAAALVFGYGDRLATFIGISALPPTGSGARLKVETASTSVTKGAQFDVTVKMDAGTNQVLAAGAYLTFDPTKLQVVSAADPVAASSFDFIIESAAQRFDNTAGTVSLSVGEPTPGVTGNNVLISTVKFQAKQTIGTAAINFNYGGSRGTGLSEVDVSDAGTPGDILDGVTNLTMNITGVAPTLTSITPNNTTVGYTSVVPITIAGQNFVSSPAPTARLKLGATTTNLTGVTYVSATSITANVPTGLAVGKYDLEVTSDTMTATLATAFEVKQVNPPLAPTVTNLSNPAKATQLAASWTLSDSTVTRYEYQVTENGVVIKPWTSTGLTTNVSLTSLSLTNGKQYIIQVRAVNAGGNGNVGNSTATTTKSANLDRSTDEKINASDFTVLVGFWGLQPTKPHADIDQNGKVDLSDFTIFLSRYAP